MADAEGAGIIPASPDPTDPVIHYSPDCSGRLAGDVVLACGAPHWQIVSAEAASVTCEACNAQAIPAWLAMVKGRGYHNGQTGAMAHRLSDCAAIDIPVLVAALEAVLKAHRPVAATGNPDGPVRCAWCRTAHGTREIWPCGEYQAISAALLGEGSG